MAKFIPSKRNPISLDFKPVILNDRVAEDFVTGFVDLFAGQLGITTRQFDFEVFADVHCTNARIAHMRQSALHCFALRVKHCLFRRNNDFRFHRSETGKLVSVRSVWNAGRGSEKIQWPGGARLQPSPDLAPKIWARREPRPTGVDRFIASGGAKRFYMRAMMAKRVIPCLDVHAGRVTRGVQFGKAEAGELRNVGDPIELASRYNEQGADEMVFFDITATAHGRATMVNVIERVAERCFMPLTVGGGVRTVADMQTMLKAGADKVSINSAALAKPDLIHEGA